ncbi:hypothetical protein Tsp_05412 [Trichinella spiralis]|uniref:hypothetical protein n=1 Tax=Trichinella spiralis TaxID=6334 RepID=UPI0001EFD558|nr:hypothetical protein Tsp_05412 [Trichinella spiralis]
MPLIHRSSHSVKLVGKVVFFLFTLTSFTSLLKQLVIYICRTYIMFIIIYLFNLFARARASCLFVVEDLQEGEVKIAMVAQCVPIVHIYQFRCPNMYLLSVECRRLIRRQKADNWCVSFNILPRPRRFDRLINHGRLVV